MSTTTNKALVAELKDVKATTSTRTVSETAQVLAAKKQDSSTAATAAPVLKVRELKDFVKVKSEAAIAKAERVIEKEHRSYIVYNIDDKHAQVYSSTTYINPVTQREEALNIAITRKLVVDFLAKLQPQAHFSTATLQKLYSTRGSNYCDLLRSALYEVGLLTTKAEATEKLSEVIAKATEHKKLLVYFDVNEDSKRHRYEYIRI